jgi:hypothetical protein
MAGHRPRRRVRPTDRKRCSATYSITLRYGWQCCAAGVKAVDVVHRDPQLTLVLAAVVNTDDVGMAEGRRQVGLAAEAGAVLVVGGHVCRKHLEGVTTRQPRVLGQIDLAPRPQQSQDGVNSENRTVRQWPGRMLQTALEAVPVVVPGIWRGGHPVPDARDRLQGWSPITPPTIHLRRIHCLHHAELQWHVVASR